MKTVIYDENEWRIVPMVATDEMRQAWWTKSGSTADDDWKVMLEAAPKPPDVEEDKHAKVACWRRVNSLGEVVTEWIDGHPPEKYFDLCGNEITDETIDLAYFASSETQPDAAQDADAARYRFLRDVSDGSQFLPFIAIKAHGGISRWTGEEADKRIDEAMSSERGRWIDDTT